MGRRKSSRLVSARTPDHPALRHRPASGRVGAADAEQQLDALILDRGQPAIARASALPLLAPYATARSEATIKAAAGEASPLVRLAVPRAFPGSPPRAVVQAVAPLLSDPVRAVRIEAARGLAGTDLLALTPQQQTAFVKATAELVSAESVDAERPEAHLNLALSALRRRELPEAEKEYRTALRLDPAFVPALVNLADLDRARGKDDEGERLLRQAMTVEPGNADVEYALGLSLVRRRDYAGAIDLLRRASELCPEKRALRLCLCRGAELDRRACRGDGSSRTDTSATSGGPRRDRRARLDRAREGRFRGSAITCARIGRA